MKHPHRLEGASRSLAQQTDTPDGRPPPPQLAMGEELSFATFKCNGILTHITEGTSKVGRLQPIHKYFKTTGVQVFAVQEPHLREGKAPEEREQELETVRDMVDRAVYAFLSQTVRTRGGGYGGAFLEEIVDM